MTCNGCKSTVSRVIKGYWNKETNSIDYICDVCSDVRTETIHDVWYGYGSGTHTEENIAYPNGHPQAGKPIPFSSKKEKWEAMKQAGVREVGDKVKGMRREDMIPSKRKTYFT